MAELKTFVMGQVGTNCYVLSNENGECIIIDCDGNSSPMENYIDSNGLRPKYILLTHGHSDHIGAVTHMARKYGAKIVGGEKEAPLLADPNANLSAVMSEPVSITLDKALKDNEVFNLIGFEFKALHTPGHTEGSVCFITGDIMFSGDTLFAGSCGRTDLPTGDYGKIVNSLKRLSALKGDYKVMPGHGEATTLDYERKTNPFMA